MATKDAPQPAQSSVAAPTSKFGDFKPIVGTTGSTIHVLETKANHSRSVELLESAGLRPLKHQEILPLLMKDETLKASLKRKWFYLAGEGLNENGIYTVDEKGDLAEIGNRETSVENKVRAWKGSNPLSFDVDSDNNAAFYGRRFNLYADFGPHDVAPVVVGVPKERAEPKQSETKAAAQAEFLRDAETVEEIALRLHEKPATTEDIKILQDFVRRTKDLATK